MSDADKTKPQLIKELTEMRHEIVKLKNDHRRVDELILQSVYSWEDTFNNITDMITIHDKDFNIIYANRAADDILGLPLLKTNRAKCYEHYHGKEYPPEGCPSCKCLETGQPVIFEKFEPHLNKYLEIRAMPQFDSDNKLMGVIHIVRDISERKQMEEALRKARDELEVRVDERTAELVKANNELMAEIGERIKIERALQGSERRFKGLSQEFNILLDAIPDNLVLLSPDMKIMWANKAAAAAFGRDVSKLRGENYFTLYSFSMRSKKSHPSILSFRTAMEEAAEITDSEGRTWDIRSFPLKDDAGKVKNVMELSRDITVKVKMEKEVKLIQAKLIHTNKMTSLGTLVSGVAHEINNPNTFIKSNAQILLKIWKESGPVLENYHKKHGDFMIAGFPYSEVRKLAPRLIKGIDEGSVRIQDIIGNLRNFARPEKANLNGRVNINEAVNASISILSNQIKKYTEELQFTGNKNLPDAKGSLQQIEQVVMNLIINSLQALKSKKDPVRLSTSFNKKINCVVIKISDEGHGMTKETMDRITDPFFTTKQDSGGTGLGLSISYAIIKEHRGNLDFHSKPGKGTTVTVELPVYE